MTERLRRAGQVSWAVVGVAALLAVFGLIAWTFRVIFPPLILAGAIVFVLNPLVTWLHRRGIHRALGTALAYSGVLGIITLAGLIIAPLANDQAHELSNEWPAISDKAERWLDNLSADSQGTFWEFDAQEVKDSFDNDTPLRDQLRRARSIGLRVFHILLILFLAPVVAFYMLVDLPHIRTSLEDLIPDGARREVMVVAHKLNRAIGGFFRGQLFVAFIVGVMCSIGLGIIQLKFWFLIGMLAGLFNVIPLIGPWVGGIPGVIIALTTGTPVQALLVVAIMVGAQQIDNHFITPQVMHRAVHLHPSVVILALLAGGTLAGFFGLLIAVPVAAALKIIIGHVWRVHILGRPIEPEPPAEPGPAIDVSPELDDEPEPEDQDPQPSSESMTSATPSP